MDDLLGVCVRGDEGGDENVAAVGTNTDTPNFSSPRVEGELSMLLLRE